MSMRLGILLGSVSLLGLAPLGALAQTDEGSYTTNGPYVGLAGGGSYMRDTSPSRFASDNASFKDAWVGLGTIGYGFGDGLRLELEGGYRSNEFYAIHGAPVTLGKTQIWTGMVNGLYDIDTTQWGIDNYGFVPHVGVGAGWANVALSNAQTFNGNTVSGHKDVFAYQGIAGIDYAVTPDFKLGVDYHFLGTDKASIETTPALTRTRASFQDNEVTFGARYEFNEPPMAPQVAAAPPPVAPPPAPVYQKPEAQRSFQVFFDFDKSDITSAASRVIQQAADSVKQGNLTRITVTGHTDTVGSSAYNQRLSERRAAAVKQTLVADGVANGEITTVGVGKTGLLVPTADGVREPQNRRAEIVLAGPGA